MQVARVHVVRPSAVSVPRTTQASANERWARFAIVLVFAALLLPRGVEVQAGTVMINPLRIILSILGSVALLKVITGRASLTFTPADWLMGIHVGIIMASGFVHEGVDEGIEIAIATGVDMGLAYLVARVATEDLRSYHFFVRTALVIATISGVFGAIEMVSGYSLIRGLFIPFFPGVPYVYLENQRLSLYRATGTFPADILFGLYCMLSVGLAINLGANRLVMRRGTYRTCTLLALLGVFSSLSSGPWLALTLVFCMMIYDRILRTEPNRWWFLVLGLLAGWLTLGTLSNRGPIKLLVDYLTLNPDSGYIRMAMLECIWDLVPKFWALGWGWGNDWPRSVEWYKWNSIDCFYAVIFLRSGVFAVFALLSFLGYSWYRAGMTALRCPSMSREVKGWIMTTVAFSFGVFTVDVFGNFVVPVYAIFGAGQVLLTFPLLPGERNSPRGARPQLSPVLPGRA